ncbi:ABC transporter permease [Halolamina sediminis]|jgi:simple sugar transport system permease protein|uniref:ABC transporter permease n=1 Tax=Halolamina sediminis TaxID=1480675 RepID=UPI0006B50FCB|nr:ABC transporter permease [Halolamina sediminis]
MNPDRLPDPIAGVMDRLVDASAGERLLVSVAALITAILLGGVVTLVAGVFAECATPIAGPFCYNPLAVYRYLFLAPLFDSFVLQETLKNSALLLFTGLAVAVSFRAGLFNIGTQGQLVLGALAAALAAVWIGPAAPSGPVGGALIAVVAMVAGAVVGGLYAAIPGALKAYADANEVITTIMLNFVASDVAFFLVSAYFQKPGSGSVETRDVPAAARFGPELALVMAIGLTLLITYLLWGTAFGYDLRTAGIQPDAADYAGVDAKRMVVTSMTLSGMIGGLGGAVWVLMSVGRWVNGVPSLGFDGITVSVLASNNPLGVLFAGPLFGSMQAGSLSIDFQLGVPRQLVGVIRGLVILLVAMPEFFRTLGVRWGMGGGR